MYRLYTVLAVVSIGLSVFCLVDVVGRRDEDIRHLPKLWWMLLVLFFPLAGGIAWLAVGRPPRVQPTDTQRAFPEYDRPGRMTGVTPESDEEFLRRVRERAEQQRVRYRQQRAAQGEHADSADPDSDPAPPPDDAGPSPH